jgi:ABC-2 type transport system ATP-binding protein
MVKINDLKFVYGGKVIIDKVNIELKPGVLYGMVGANGAGKTTLMKLIMKYLIPSNGTIENTSKHQIYVPAEIQFPKYIKHGSLVNSVLEMSTNDKKELKEFNNKYYSMLDIGSIEKKLLLSKFSSGMQKKVGLGLALTPNKYDLYMFDEPTTLIDPPTKEKYFKLIKELNKKENTLVILSSHETLELEKQVDKFIIVHNGQVTVKDNNAKTKKEIANM